MGLRHPVLNVRYKMTVQLDFGESYSIYAKNMTIQLETAMEWLQLVGSSKS